MTFRSSLRRTKVGAEEVEQVESRSGEAGNWESGKVIKSQACYGDELVMDW